jgi:cation diffusion facilitator family transporter
MRSDSSFFFIFNNLHPPRERKSSTFRKTSSLQKRALKCTHRSARSNRKRGKIKMGDEASDNYRHNPALAGSSYRREQLEGLRNRLPSLTDQSANPKSKVAKYYSRQTRIVEQFQELENFIERTTYGGGGGRHQQHQHAASSPSSPNSDTGDGGENLLQSDANFREQKRQETLALRTSFYVNVLLLAVKIFASVQSGSLSIITSALDSFLDLISGLILYFTDKHMQNMNKYLYPIGKSRMQPLGILVFACIMGTLGFQVFIEGVQQLVGKEHTHHLEDLQLVIGIMIGVIVVKFFLYLYCRGSRNRSVQTYAQDHRNDVITNTFGLIAAIVGDRIYYWFDPLGAMILAAYIVQNWSATALENIKAMVGLSAPPEFLTKLTYLAWNSDPRILGVDTVRAYTFGPAFFVEVDVVLPEDMSVRVAHDIGEALQDRIEKLPEVERAFVHIDFETDHQPEHNTSWFEEKERMMKEDEDKKAKNNKKNKQEVEMAKMVKKIDQQRELAVPESPLARNQNTIRAALGEE